MHLAAISQNLQIFTGDGGKLMLVNMKADAVFKRVMLTRDEAETMKHLIETVIESEEIKENGDD
jgi:hypothetical protein